MWVNVIVSSSRQGYASAEEHDSTQPCRPAKSLVNASDIKRNQCREGDELPVFLRAQAPGAALRHQRMVALPALRGPARVDLAEQCRLRRVIRWAEADGAHGVGQQVRSDIA